MFVPDPKTLSLLVGLANLLFALTATLYILKTRTRHLALETWRWGRLVASAGNFVNLASSGGVEWLPVALGNILQIAAASLDIAAYCMLLDRQRWQRPLLVLAGVSIGLLLITVLLGATQSVRLLVFSSLGVCFYAVLATLVLQASRDDWLLKLIGLIDGLMAFALLLRVGKGLFVSPLVRFDVDWITLLLYVSAYLVVMVNGFGFLLLTKQKNDRALYRALDELAAIEEDRVRFLAQASHEFRTPAAMIKASLDSLRFMQHTLPPEVLSRLDNIQLAAQRMIELSNTLLTQDRLNHQATLFKPEMLDVGDTLRDVLRLYPAEARIEFESPVPPLQLRADPIQLHIAVHNLIDNALEHNPVHHAPVRVYVRSTTDSVEICVADCGSGITDAKKPQVFNRFHSRHGSFTRGVGLSIVDQIARKHGGEAVVRDNTPCGTVMVLRLPANV